MTLRVGSGLVLLLGCGRIGFGYVEEVNEIKKFPGQLSANDKVGITEKVNFGILVVSDLVRDLGDVT